MTLYFHISMGGKARYDWKTAFHDFPQINVLSWEIGGRRVEGGIEDFIEDCRRAGRICAYNVHAGTAAVKSAYLRAYGWRGYYKADVEAALSRDKRVDLMRSAVVWVDASYPDGQPKLPTFQELFSRCYPREPFTDDVEAVIRCAEVLEREGLLKRPRTAPISPAKGEDDKLYKQEFKARKNDFFKKITPQNYIVMPKEIRLNFPPDAIVKYARGWAKKVAEDNLNGPAETAMAKDIVTLVELAKSYLVPKGHGKGGI